MNDDRLAARLLQISSPASRIEHESNDCFADPHVVARSQASTGPICLLKVNPHRSNMALLSFTV